MTAMTTVTITVMTALLKTGRVNREEELHLQPRVFSRVVMILLTVLLREIVYTGPPSGRPKLQTVGLAISVKT